MFNNRRDQIILTEFDGGSKLGISILAFKAMDLIGFDILTNEVFNLRFLIQHGCFVTGNRQHQVVLVLPDLSLMNDQYKQGKHKNPSHCNQNLAGAKGQAYCNTKEKVYSIINYFLELSYLTKSDVNEGFNIKRTGFNCLPIWAALIKTFLESYWIVTKSLGQKKSKQKKKGDLEKHINYLGKRFYTLGVVEHIGALSSSNFKNAIKVSINST